MYTKFLVLFSIAAAFILSSCAPEHSKIVLSEFGGDHQITMKEFEDAYSKNVGNSEDVKKDSIAQLKNFLDLYTVFKMKLRDAEVRGFDQDTSLQNELTDYKNKVGVTFLLNKEIVDPGIKDLYEKRKYELRVSHIMIRPDSSGNKAAELLAAAILDSIKNGASFEEMAKRHSQDVYSAASGGDIYYITAGLLPEPFENAAYETEPGHVYPNVVQTQFGYHLIKVTEKIKRIPEIRASHILVRFGNENGKIDTAAAKARIDSVVEKLKNGVDFAELAKEYSEDPGSKAKGGDLGFFTRRQMVKNFDEAAFKLKVGEVSGIIRTQYGYHLIKLTDEKKYPTLEEDKENLKKIIEKTTYQAKYDSLVSKLKSKYDYKMIGKTLDYIASNADSAAFGSDSSLIEKAKGMTIYSFTGTSKDAGSFLMDLGNDSKYERERITLQTLTQAVNKKSSDALLEKEADNLVKTDSAYSALLDDYRAGIYIFKLQSDEVWEKVNIDSTKLHNYYEENKENYKWPNRASYSYVTFVNEEAANNAYQKLQNGVSFDSLGANVIDEKDLLSADESDITKEAFKLASSGDYSKPFKYKTIFYIVKLKGKEASHIKSFEDARPNINADLQDKEAKKLENDYVQKLKERYQPVYHYDELTKAFKNS